MGKRLRLGPQALVAQPELVENQTTRLRVSAKAFRLASPRRPLERAAFRAALSVYGRLAWPRTEGLTCGTAAGYRCRSASASPHVAQRAPAHRRSGRRASRRRTGRSAEGEGGQCLCSSRPRARWRRLGGSRRSRTAGVACSRSLRPSLSAQAPPRRRRSAVRKGREGRPNRSHS